MLEIAKQDHMRSVDGIERLQAQMTFRFSVLSKLLDRQMATIAAEFGLSLGAYRGLAAIDAFGEITAAELVRYTGYDKAGVSRQIAELRAKELVAVTEDPDHGRRKLIKVAPEGAKLLRQVAPVVAARRDKLSAQLTSDEEAIFLRSIEKLAAHVAAEMKLK